MNWYKIGQRTAARSVSWLNTTRSPFSTKFGFPYTLSVSGSNLFPLFRQLLIPCNRTIAVTINVKCIHVSHCVSYSNESDSDGEEISEEVMDLYNEPDMHSLRNLLYTDFDNPLMKQLNEATSVQDVFNFIKQHESDMDEQLTSQSVLILWDLQKIFYNVNALNLHPNPVISALLNPHEVVKNYVSEVNGHKDFELLLSLVDKWYKDMSVEALTATVLYLNKMGVGLGSPIVQKLISHCEDMLEMFGSRFPLTSLSRFTVVVCSRHDLWPILVCKNAVPHIFNSIDLCENADDFRLLTICLTNIRQLISFSTLYRYKCKLEQLVDNGTITAKDSKVICKIVRFLNYPHWSSFNCSTIRKTILLLKGHVKEMLPQDLIILHKVYQSQLEPADIIDEMHEAATEFLSQAKNATIGSSPLALQGTTDLLDCLVSFSSPEQKTMLEKLALHHVESCAANNLPTLFRILRQLKTSNIQLCNAFWSKTLQLMKDLPSERVDYKLFRVTHRYMYFNNNLGGTYRHYDLEKYLIHWLWNEAVDKNACLIPSKFSRIASFMLAYGNIGQNRPVITEPIVTQLVQKILDLTPQFSKMDCLYISRGLKIGASLGHQKRNPSQRFLDAFTKIETALNNDAIEKLKGSDLKLSDVNKLMNAYVSRGRIEDSGLYEQILQRYEDVDTIYSSRDLREAATNLLSTNSLVPGALDCMVQYVIENGAHLTGDTLLRLLHTCYVLGYTPTQAEDFFPVASSIVIRDRERLQGLIILQAAIALCFFHQLPEELLHFIFTVNFLERLDEEVHNCYAKATYPMRVRYAMMHLNRAVCLDYPETDVPWFHEKYCQQTAVMESQLLNPLKKNVHQSLVSVLGAENLISVKKYSPYFYNIDFQVLLNKNREPVSIKQEADTGITKIAFLIWGKNAYTNGVTQLCGEQQLKQRHLEMLGYRVVGISSFLWNSMYMAEPKAKVDYLRDKIWPSTVDSKSQKSCGLS